MTITRTLTCAGKRYRLTWLVCSQVIQVTGPGILTVLYLPDGVTLELPDADLREVLKEALENYATHQL
jgi:hypothetical protein